VAARHLGRRDEAERYFADTLGIWQTFDTHSVPNAAVPRGAAIANLASVALDRGDYAVAVSRYNEALPILRAAGDANFLSLNLTNLALARIHLGEQATVQELLDEGLALAHGQDDRRTIALNLAVRALLALNERRLSLAANLIGVLEGALEGAGLPVPPAEPIDYEQLVARIRTAIGATRYTAAHADGKSWPLGEALTSVLKATDLAVLQERAAASPTLAALSRREREVLPLVAQGLSNRAIAGQLHVGQRTIETHVSNIIGKLGLQNRMQIIAWITAQEVLPC